MLPTNLKTAYDEIYGKIKAYNEHDRTLADRAFKWVACAHKPLSIKGLLSAIRWDSDTDTPDLSDIITESQLLHLCNNLLIIDSQRDVWRFSHLSVAEYFEENHWDLQRVHCHAASVCLKVLIEMYKNVDPDQIAVGESNLLSRTKRLSWCVGAKRQVKLGSSFQEYARDYWMVHTQAQERPGVDSSLSQLLKSFLGSPKESSLQYRAWYLKFSDKHWDTVSVRPDLSPGTVALFAMCRFSFYYILQDWWESAEFDVSMTTYSGYNLLALAAMGGCKHICANLINRGMEVNMQLKHRQHGSALIAAVSTGQIETVKFLVKEAGADVDIQLQSWTYGSALAAAAYEGQIEIVKFLVNEAGANVNMLLECWWHGSALAAAAEAGTLEVVKFLVHEAGADVNMQLPKNAESGSVLGIAACSGHPEVTRFLIDEAGAEVNMQLQNGNWGSALAGAAWAGNTQVIELLLQAGADVNMRLQNGEYGSALAAAARASPHYGEIKLSHVLKKTQHGAMRLLLQAGADVNAQLESGRFGSALIFPIERDEAGDVEFLVNAGLDVNQQVQHGDFGTALAAAAFFGSNKCADILIKAGANVNLEIENGLFRTALQAAQADASKISRRPRRLEEVEQGRAKVVGMIKLYGGTDEV
jgi:ankyrin repeat protein